MDEFGDFFLPSRGTYIPEKRLKQPTSSKTFLRNRLSPSGVSGPMDGCGWNWTTLQTSWMALPRLTSTLVLPQKIQAFLPEKNEPEGCGIEKDGKNPLPTNNKQKTYLKDCCFLELERHLWTFMRWFGVFGDVGKLLSFWGVARFFFFETGKLSLFLCLVFLGGGEKSWCDLGTEAYLYMDWLLGKDNNPHRRLVMVWGVLFIHLTWTLGLGA